MRQAITAQSFREFLDGQSDLDVVRIAYCYQMGSTYVNLALMEVSIINAMVICDKIKLGRLLGTDATAAEHLLEKIEAFRSSTLGNLIALLSKNGISKEDLDYLKWVKEKRDFFIHRFFHQGGWPGDLGTEEIELLCRRLRYLEYIFMRGSRRIWDIFGRADLMQCQDLGPNGMLVFNHGLFGPDGMSAASEDADCRED